MYIYSHVFLEIAFKMMFLDRPSHYTAIKQMHFVVKPLLVMPHNWNITIGSIPCLAEASLGPCDDNKPSSTQRNIWPVFLSACLVSDTLLYGPWSRLWLWAQHIASSTPKTAGFPGPDRMCRPPGALRKPGKTGRNVRREVLAGCDAFANPCSYLHSFVWICFSHFPHCPFQYCLVTLRCSFFFFKALCYLSFFPFSPLPFSLSW